MLIIYMECDYLPTKDIKWDCDEWSKEKILKLEDYAETGYLFSVDLSFDPKLHEHFSNYSLIYGHKKNIKKVI